MDKILSQQEVNTLLNSPAGAEQNGDSSHSGAIVGKLTVYNFRRPERFPKPVLSALQRIHDRFCTNAAASFSGYFRTATEMTVVSAEQSTYGDFLKSLAADLGLAPDVESTKHHHHHHHGDDHTHTHEGGGHDHHH